MDDGYSGNTTLKEIFQGWIAGGQSVRWNRPGHRKRKIYSHCRCIRIWKNYVVKYDCRVIRAHGRNRDRLDLSKMGEEQLTVFRRRKIGFVFQGYNLIPELTVKENIMFPLALDDTRLDGAYFSNLVRMLGLDDYLDARPHMLSGGAQQCTAIARALITKPSIILADEPTGSFDMKTTQNVAGLLKMTAATFHQTLVVITHNLELAQLADRVVRLQDGKIV